MRDENPRASSKLSFKAQKPAGVLLSRIPRKHSCQDGAWQGGGAAPRDTASPCQPHGSSSAAPPAAAFPPEPSGTKGLQSHSRGFMAETEERYGGVTSKTSALPSP